MTYTNVLNFTVISPMNTTALTLLLCNATLCHVPTRTARV